MQAITPTPLMFVVWLSDCLITLDLGHGTGSRNCTHYAVWRLDQRRRQRDDAITCGGLSVKVKVTAWSPVQMWRIIGARIATGRKKSLVHRSNAASLYRQLAECRLIDLMHRRPIMFHFFVSTVNSNRCDWRNVSKRWQRDFIKEKVQLFVFFWFSVSFF